MNRSNITLVDLVMLLYTDGRCYIPCATGGHGWQRTDTLRLELGALCTISFCLSLVENLDSLLVFSAHHSADSGKLTPFPVR
jgi:hypothetical protein